MSTLNQKARFDTRLSKAQKELFEKAARLSGFHSLSEFVISTVHKRAVKIIEEQEQIIASEKDSALFFDAITNPTQPNQALQDAAKEYRSKLDE